MKIAYSDPDIMVRQKRHAKPELLDYLDVSGDGTLDGEESQIIASTELVTTWLGSMDLECEDLLALFRFPDKDGTYAISFDELIHGVQKLKGPAEADDMMRMLRIL